MLRAAPIAMLFLHHDYAAIEMSERTTCVPAAVAHWLLEHQSDKHSVTFLPQSAVDAYQGALAPLPLGNGTRRVGMTFDDVTRNQDI